MRIAKCLQTGAYGEGVPLAFSVWVEDTAKVGDVLYNTDMGCGIRIIGLSGSSQPVKETPPLPQKTEYVNAEDLQVGDEIHYCNEWRTVLSVYLHPKSCYQKANVTQGDSNIPLSVRIGRRTEIERKTRNYVMSLALLSAHELVKTIQAKLIDFQALNDAAERIEVVPSVFIDKGPVMLALKSDIKAEYAKLGEKLKKL